MEAVEYVSDQITVLDFAPPTQNVKGVNIGGYLLEDSHPKIKCLYSKLIKTPRLSAEDRYDLIRLAKYNRKITETLITQVLDSPTKTLFINDISIHLQWGHLKELWRVIKNTSTVVANGYMGSTLMQDHGSGVSDHEKVMMQQLSTKMDKVIML